MTREEFVKKIHWDVIIWIISFVNAIAMTPQLVQIIKTKNVEGLSLATFIIVVIIQIGFAFEFFFSRKIIMTLLMLVAMLVSCSIISCIVYLRYFV